MATLIWGANPSPTPAIGGAILAGRSSHWVQSHVDEKGLDHSRTSKDHSGQRVLWWRDDGFNDKAVHGTSYTSYSAGQYTGLQIIVCISWSASNTRKNHNFIKPKVASSTWFFFPIILWSTWKTLLAFSHVFDDESYRTITAKPMHK